jgi:hypothetical protein
MAFAFALLAALVHGYIFYLERLRYGSPAFCRTFGIARENLAAARAAFYNLAVYNLSIGVLALAGALLHAFSSDGDTRIFAAGIQSAALLVMLAAAGYLAASAPSKRRAAAVQGVPAALSLLGLICG